MQKWLGTLKKETASTLRWLAPGLGVKRWFFLLLLGVTLLGVGLAYYLLDFYRSTAADDIISVLNVATLRFLPRLIRVVIFGGLGVFLIFLGIWGLNRALLNPFMRPGARLVDQIASYRRRERGPRIVTLGGGHGMATLLRGLKNHTSNLTAVVTVADDGGSSGMLRQSLGILPPGDIRNCLAALSNDEALLAQLFQYRFSDDTGLGGHSFGNLFISALAEITGSFEDAVTESGRVLSVHGQVLPATLHDIRLVAEVRLPNTVNEIRVEGESRIPSMPGRVRRVTIEPNNPSAFPPVIQAILAADMIVIGPGSLYTSLLPNLLVPDLLAAIRASTAMKAYVVNIATQRGETAAYTCSDHIRVFEEHVGADLFDVIVYNNNYEGALPNGVDWVKLDQKAAVYPVFGADVLDVERPWRHDSDKLAENLMDLLFERKGPLALGNDEL
ncbi:MAG: uridine diphosphate-N-acetylglucosamine-binding protein YvcK [Anaerolineales bacterium]